MFDLSSRRYLTRQECGWVAIVVFIMWLGLGRYAERSINRSYERSMMDQSGINSNERFSSKSSVETICSWCERLWDYVCPLFLQRKIYTPKWNKRTHREIVNHIKVARSNDGREHSSLFYANEGQMKGDRILTSSKPLSFNKKALICCLVGIGSFTAVSPHYILNFCTVFFGSIGMVSNIMFVVDS